MARRWEDGAHYVVSGLSLVALSVAVYERRFPLALAPLVLLLLLVSLGCLGRLAAALEHGRLGVESRWSGLGRGTAGWHLSPALTYLLGLLLFVGALAGVTFGGLEQSRGEAAAARSTSTSPSPQPLASQARDAAAANPTASASTAPVPPPASPLP